ncbi:MAG: acetate--CoA ligase family protein [Nocardioides sp.]
MHHPQGHDLDHDQRRDLLAAYGIEAWEAPRVESLDEAVAAAERLGWDVVLKATAERLRNRPDLAHVWRNIDDAEEMADAWATLTGLITDPAHAGFVVQKNAPPGVPVAIGSMEDPLFGPVVSFGISGAFTELLGDKAYRIPPLSAQDAADIVREIKASPLLFGYRGSEVVDVPAVEQLVLKVSQLQHDLPQVRSLDLSLVLVNANGASVLTSCIRVEPVIDPRSDWFVRRMARPPGDTIPE